MNSSALRFGIPNVELGCASGTKINPSSFAGHQLIVLFCPMDKVAASQEIASYQKFSAELVRLDAWLLTFGDDCDDIAVDRGTRVLTIPDTDRHAWVAFRNLTEHPEELDRSSGATFLFTRGGGLHRYWRGLGHVNEVLAELGIPSSMHPHQAAD